PTPPPPPLPYTTLFRSEPADVIRTHTQMQERRPRERGSRSPALQRAVELERAAEAVSDHRLVERHRRRRAAPSGDAPTLDLAVRSEEHTSSSHDQISYA